MSAKGIVFRDASNREIKLRKERDLYFTEKDGARVKSVSTRLPAYAGTTLQAKHGGRKENECRQEEQPQQEKK